MRRGSVGLLLLLALVGCDDINAAIKTQEVEPNDDPAHATPAEHAGQNGFYGDCEGSGQDYFVMDGTPGSNACVAVWCQDPEDGVDPSFDVELISEDFDLVATVEYRYDGLQPTLVAEGVVETEGPVLVLVHCNTVAPAAVAHYEGDLSNQSNHTGQDCN